MVVTCNGEAGLEEVLDGAGDGGRTRGESPSGGWIISARMRSAAITTLRCVAMVDMRSEGLECDIIEVTRV